MKVPKLVENSAIYGIITVLQKGISFFLLPLYTAFLTPSDYGILSIVTSVSSLISVFILMGLTAAGTRFYYLHKEDEEYNKKLWGSIVSFVLISSIIAGALFIAFHKFLIDPIVGKIEFYPYMLLGIGYTIMSPLYLFFQTYLQTRQLGVHYGINTLFNFLLNVGLIILFVAYLKLQVLGVLLANLITAVVFFIYVIIAFVPKIKLNLNKNILSPSLKYSLPLVPHLLAGWLSGMIDRLLINGMRNEKETGLYSVAGQFGSIINSVADAINMAYTPWFFDAYEKNRTQDIKNVGSMIIYIYCAISFALSIFAPEVLQLMVSKEFRGIWSIIPLLSFAYVFQGFYYLFVNVLFLNKTKLVFIISISTLLLNIILNILLIPKFGFLGSAIACFVSYFVKSIIALILSEKEVKNIRFDSIKLYFVAIILFALTFINYLFQNLPIGFSLLLKFLLCGSICLSIYFRYKSSFKMLLKMIRN